MPGNLAELRPLVFIATFVGLLVLLVGMMVSGSPAMFSGQTTGSSGIGGSSTNPSSLMAWNVSYVHNITDISNEQKDFVIQGWNIRFWAYASNEVRMLTYDYWWIFSWNIDYFSWYKEGLIVSGTYNLLSISVLDANYAAGKTLDYLVKNSKTQMTVSFVFNSSAYPKPSDAYTAGKLSVVFQQDFNDRNTSINVLGFVSQIFSFSLPGMPVFVNLMLWIMIFPSIMYLSAIFVLKILGAIFGGG